VNSCLVVVVELIDEGITPVYILTQIPVNSTSKVVMEKRQVRLLTRCTIRFSCRNSRRLNSGKLRRRVLLGTWFNDSDDNDFVFSILSLDDCGLSRRHRC
jgi:hypothetical protein